MKLADISRTKRRNIWQLKSINLKLTVRSNMPETWLRAPITLRRVTRLVKDEKGDLVTDSHTVFVRWRNQFSRLLNVHEVNDVRQTEVHTAEPPVPEPSAFEIEMDIEKLKWHRSPGIDQIPAGVGQFVLRSINLLTLFGIRRNSKRSGRSRLLTYLLHGAEFFLRS